MSARAFWVALLLLSFVWQPTLLAASEAHETEHLLQTGHTHDADHEGSGIPADEIDATGDGDLLHGLMHLGHCCGQTSAMLFEGLWIAASKCLVATSPEPLLLMCGPVLPQPLRPPIRG